MKKFFLVMAVLASFQSYAEQKFNALDTDDKSFAEYQRNLCDGTAEMRDLFAADVFWLTKRKTLLSENTAVDFVISKTLYEKYRDRYDTNCR